MQNRLVFNLRPGLELTDVHPDVKYMMLAFGSLSKLFSDVIYESADSCVVVHKFMDVDMAKACRRSEEGSLLKCRAVIKEEDYDDYADETLDEEEEERKLERVGRWIEQQEFGVRMEEGKEPEDFCDTVSVPEYIDTSINVETCSNESGACGRHYVTMEEQELVTLEVQVEHGMEEYAHNTPENTDEHVACETSADVQNQHVQRGQNVDFACGEREIGSVDHSMEWDVGSVDLFPEVEINCEGDEIEAEPSCLHESRTLGGNGGVGEDVVDVVRDIVSMVVDSSKSKSADAVNLSGLLAGETAITTKGSSMNCPATTFCAPEPPSEDVVADGTSPTLDSLGDVDCVHSRTVIESSPQLLNGSVPMDLAVHGARSENGRAADCTVSSADVIDNLPTGDVSTNDPSDDNLGELMHMGLKLDPVDGNVWYSNGRLCFHPRKCELCGANSSFMSQAIRHLTSHMPKKEPTFFIFRCLHCSFKSNRHDCVLRHFKASSHKQFCPPSFNVNYEEDWSQETVELMCSLAVKCFPDISQYLTKGVERARQLAELRKEMKVEKVEKARNAKKPRTVPRKSVEPELSV